MAQNVENRATVPVPAPRHFRVPWKEILLAAVILIAAGAVAFGAKMLYSNLTGEWWKSAAPAQVEQPAAQPAQQVPEAVAPAKEWPKVQVVWTPVTDLSILPPAEQGFYNGTMENSSGLFNSIGTHEWGVYAAKIVANRYQYTDLDLSTAGAAISRDPSNSRIVLAGLDLTHVVPSADPHAVPPKVFPSARLFLSTDGEKTWKEINLTPPKFEGAIVLPWETRVVSQSDGSIRLFVMGGGGAARNGHWWTATLAP